MRTSFCWWMLLSCGAAFPLAYGCSGPPVPVPTPTAVAAEFVNFESPHVHPLELLPDRTRLLAVNTAANTLDVINVARPTPAVILSIPVGLDPVSVRARSNTEAWVVNRVSDSVSVVDLQAGVVVRTLRVGDEPGDVAFAGSRAFVTCLEPSRVLVYNLDDLEAAPTTIAISGHDPRALAVSAGGTEIYVANFESGNHSTVLDQHVVDRTDSPYAGQNPPPNNGTGFLPEIAASLFPTNPASLIVRKTGGAWLDDNGRDWSRFVTWDLHDRDLAIIDAASLSVRYVTGIMTINMNLAARPDGKVVIIGTEAINEIRFEPVLTGRFVQSNAAIVDPARGTFSVVSLNPHLAEAYNSKAKRVATDLRTLSLADPRDIVWRSDSTVGYVAGLGSNNVVRIDATGARIEQTDVGQGPTGLALDETHDRLYVLNRFDATVSVLDATTMSAVTSVALFDPTPVEIREGRPLLYDARRTSGYGVTSCASCHVDARGDGLAWDLGDPQGEILPFDQLCDNLNGLIDKPRCEDFHPIKGPMVTQSLQSIIGTEPLHWRGDRPTLTQFDAAFRALLGSDSDATLAEINALRLFLATIKYPPNPNRNLDDSLRTELGNGNPAAGEVVFTSGNHDLNRLNCNVCHAGALGTNQKVTPGSALDGFSMKVPQLRGLYKKQGFDKVSQENDRGFGFTHDGRFGTIPEFLHFRVFTFAAGEAGEQQRRDAEAFLMSFPGDVHPAVGTQVTLTGGNAASGDVNSLLDLMVSLANEGKVGLVVHARVADVPRGYALTAVDTLQSDRTGEQVAVPALRALAGDGAEQTWTVVPYGSEKRLGIDRDLDGVLNGD